jgi:hypothetical protein
MIAIYRSWRREHPDVPAPLSIHGMLATIIIWYLATAGLAAERGLPQFDELAAECCWWNYLPIGLVSLLSATVAKLAAHPPIVGYELRQKCAQRRLLGVHDLGRE